MSRCLLLIAHSLVRERETLLDLEERESVQVQHKFVDSASTQKHPQVINFECDEFTVLKHGISLGIEIVIEIEKLHRIGDAALLQLENRL